MTARRRHGRQAHLDTEATSGAGSGKVGIAGSLALTIADITTNAEFRSNATRGPPGDDLNGGDLTLSATAAVSSTAKAMAKDTDAGTVGIGAGVAINIVNDTTTASIDSGATFSRDRQARQRHAHARRDTDTMTTYAEAGATAQRARRSRSRRRRDLLPTVLTTATIDGNGTQDARRPRAP